jgi:excisionase family DNA binding protein
MEQNFLTQSELAKRWGISPRTLERWRWAGEGLRFVKIGGLVRYRLEDVEAYEASNEIPKDSDLKDETPSGGDA